ncbi:hypothetical protein [uncultured Tateyamaria sp.]|uniref:hypothetical protein n=1 Tax=Tateyamaria sp. 1078 TaxID=3417464 RepID=UPI00262C0FFD|nr:hypothetical protein [uncultured Tateyamaria sp.]
MMRVLPMFAVLALTGCFGSAPERMNLSFGTYSATPAVITALTINGVTPSVLLPSVQAGRADAVPIRNSSGTYLLAWPGDTDTAVIEATWVELLSDRAYTAGAEVNTADLHQTKTAFQTAYVLLIFGPHGLMIVGSDAPQATPEPHDLARICGVRRPALDYDFAAKPRAHPRLSETLAETYPPVSGTTECPEPGK